MAFDLSNMLQLTSLDCEFLRDHGFFHDHYFLVFELIEPTTKFMCTKSLCKNDFTGHKNRVKVQKMSHNLTSNDKV